MANVVVRVIPKTAVDHCKERFPEASSVPPSIATRIRLTESGWRLSLPLPPESLLSFFARNFPKIKGIQEKRT